MDTLAAKDQENFVHNLQAAAASKPLNAGLRGFTKTPAKTPFKIPLNDENALGKGGKSVMQTKGKGNEFLTVKKDGKLDNSAFVTPGMFDTSIIVSCIDMRRPSQSRAAGHEDDQCQRQSFPNTRASLWIHQNAESQPSSAPPKGQSPAAG